MNPLQRKKKILLLLPILILPFITLAFWALGGGNVGGKEILQPAAVQGLNLDLPAAKLKEEDGMDKLAYYEVADADSAKQKAQVKNDRNYRTDTMPSVVYKKLEQLNAALEPKAKEYIPQEQPALKSPEADRLETMMHAMQQKDTAADPEVQQINSMLEKVIDIQHPERVKENPPLQAKPTFEVTKKEENTNGFYSLDDEDKEHPSQTAIEAVIHETQTITSGASVKLRLSNDIHVNGILIPKDNFVFGTAALNGERLNITINTIRCENILLSVSLSVYDMDGMEGIYIPGSVTRDVSKQSTDNALQGIGLSSIDPSIAMQAAGAGIETAKNLISKKLKLIKVTLKAGYQVLLKDNKNK